AARQVFLSRALVSAQTHPLDLRAQIDHQRVHVLRIGQKLGVTRIELRLNDGHNGYSRRIASEPLLERRSLVRGHRVKQPRWIGVRDDHLAMAWLHEVLLHSMVEHGDHSIVVTVDVQHAAGLVVQAELRPGYRLTELLEGAEAAGHGDETVREL